jgi:hypothetical protein
MQDYEVKVTYEGYICLEAENEAEAKRKAFEIWREETTHETAKYSEYLIEQEIAV